MIPSTGFSSAKIAHTMIRDPQTIDAHQALIFNFLSVNDVTIAIIPIARRAINVSTGTNVRTIGNFVINIIPISKMTEFKQM